MSPPYPNNGQNTGSLKNNYRVSSVTGGMAANDANDAWDGGVTVNLSPGTGSSNYTVVVLVSMRLVDIIILPTSQIYHIPEL